MLKTLRILVISFLILLPNTILYAEEINKPGVASAHPLATKVGYEILAQGGNAFDAAVAISATLSVVEPYSSGLGGGGFFLLHDSSSMEDVFVDAREKAPSNANRDCLLYTSPSTRD